VRLAGGGGHSEINVKHNRFDIGCVITAVLLLAISSATQEKRITKSALPIAVQRAAEEQTKGASIRGYSTEIENGRREYEVETILNGHSRDITFAPDGSVLELEEQVKLSDLPAAVRDGLQRKAGSGRIAKVESLTKQGKVVAYEADVRSAAKRYEIQIGPDGKALAHPE
jgi:uncharacterized membrane protein YkoI